MSAIAIPAPGGSVTLGRFAIMSVGAAAGMFIGQTYVGPALPAALVNWQLGPINGGMVWTGAFALLGGAAASMAFSKFGK